MIQQKKINIERILSANRIGAWRIEIEDGKAPRFYADAMMDELLGIEGEICISSGTCTSGRYAVISGILG